MGSKGCLPSLLIKKIEWSSIFEHLLSYNFSEKDVANQNAFFLLADEEWKLQSVKKNENVAFSTRTQAQFKKTVLKVNCTNILRVLDYFNKREYLMDLHNM